MLVEARSLPHRGRLEARHDHAQVREEQGILAEVSLLPRRVVACSEDLDLIRNARVGLDVVRQEPVESPQPQHERDDREAEQRDARITARNTGRLSGERHDGNGYADRPTRRTTW